MPTGVWLVKQGQLKGAPLAPQGAQKFILNGIVGSVVCNWRSQQGEMLLFLPVTSHLRAVVVVGGVDRHGVGGHLV